VCPNIFIFLYIQLQLVKNFSFLSKIWPDSCRRLLPAWRWTFAPWCRCYDQTCDVWNKEIRLHRSDSY